MTEIFTPFQWQDGNVIMRPTYNTNTTIIGDVLHHKQIAYSSTEEQILSIIFLITCSVIGVLGQGSVIFTIIATESLHDIHSYIIATHCIGDLVLCLAMPMFLVQLITGTIHMMSLLICSVLAFSLTHALNFNNGLLAYER